MLGKMLFQIGIGLLVICVDLIALSIKSNCFFDIPHLVIDMSNLRKCISPFIIYLHALVEALKGLFEVSLVLVNRSQAMERYLILLILLEALCKTGDCLLFSVQGVIKSPDRCNRSIILRTIVEVFKIIMQLFLLVLATIFSQPSVSQAELWVKFDDLSEVVESFFAIFTIELVPRATISRIIIFAVIEACRLPQGPNMSWVQLNALFKLHHSTLYIRAGCFDLLVQGFCLCFVIEIFH